MTADDCNANGIPDSCDLDETDPDGNGLVSADCNESQTPDECDIANGTADDCNGNGVPDECDLAETIVYDILDADLVSASTLCGNNARIRVGDMLGFSWLDVGTKAAFKVRIEINVGLDCNVPGALHPTTLNGVADAPVTSARSWCSCGLSNTVVETVTANIQSYRVGEVNTFMINELATDFGFTPNNDWGPGVYVRVTVDYGVSPDLNGNGVLDVCDAPGDFDGDGAVTLDDYTQFSDCFTNPGEPIMPGCELADTDNDGDVDIEDFSEFQNAFGL